MNSQFSTIPLWSYGIAIASYLMLTIHLLHWRTPAGQDRATTAIVIAAFTSVIWAICSFAFVLTAAPRIAALQNATDTLRYGAWFTFLLLLIYPRPQPSRPIWPVTIGLTIVGIGLAIQFGGMTIASSPEILIRGGQYAALAQVVFALTLLEQLFRNTTADSLWNIKPLGIGLAAIFAFDLYFYSHVLLFNQIDPDAFAVRGFANTLVLPLILLTIYRSTRTRKLQVALSQTAAFQTTSLAVAGLYLLIASAAGYYVRYLGGSWGGAMQIAVLFTALVLLVMIGLSGTMRSRLKVLVGKHFFRYRYDYREEWLKFTQALSSEDDTRQVGQQVIRGLANMLESPAGTLWIRDAEGRQYTQRARWNLPAVDDIEPADGALIRFLTDRGWVLNLEEFRHLPGRYHGLILPNWLSNLPNAWLVVPLATAGGIVGFVVLTTSRAPLDVNWEVNDLLRTAGRQAAAFLAQMQATEALLEARKFDSFNRMSAFVVHDLKNIVSQLSLMVRNAERHADNIEFQRDMLLTVHHSVERMKQLMMQLREGATPPDGSCGVNLAAVVGRIQKAKAAQSPGIDLDIREPTFARGHEERIERVIGHLVQNALDATPPEGKVWIRLAREGSMALIEIGDTGCGMPADFVRDNLFKPFRTTKETGMGIGAYESRQYVRELGGDIRVESAENTGTRFHVRLPAIEIRKTSDLQ